MNHLAPAFALTAFATAALAHTGVTNPAVLARMEAMSAVAEEVKALSAMARGDVAFDADAVAARMETIAAAGAEVPMLFEAPEQDPASEASAAIWTSFPEFTQRASAMVEAAKAGAAAANKKELGKALSALGQTCKSCHSSFKVGL